MRWKPSLLLLGGLLLTLAGLPPALSGCGVDAESETGLVVVVTLDDSALVDGASPELTALRFYVAVQVDADKDLWVLNEALAGRPVEVAGRDLKEEPYRLFLAESGDGQLETLRILVVGEKDGTRRLLGQLVDPSVQALQRGRILERTVALLPDADRLGLTWTASGCLLSADGTIRFGSAADRDCDGHLSVEFGGEDCDDLDPKTNPAAPDDDCDGKDNDCRDGPDQNGDLDRDQDGYTPCGGDCDDDNPDIHPGAEERCDGVDNNCNGKCDEGTDLDGDGYTWCGTLLVNGGEQCVMVPFGDCDDSAPDIHPGAEEKCDGVDNNCNGLCDERTDRDGDGFNECGTIPGEPVSEEGLCTAPAAERIDCAPEDSAVHPFALERCDGIDNDCNGETSAQPTICYAWESTPGEGRCLQGVATCTEGNGTGTWSACAADTTTAEPASPVMCTAWDLCAATAAPAECLTEKVAVLDLTCKTHTLLAETEACFEDPPTYYLPLGLANLGSCTWTLQLDYVTYGWQLIGLVDPQNPSAPTVRLHSCEAALVARPAPFGTTAPAPLTGTISFVHTSAQESVLLLIPFSVGADHDCAMGSSLTCDLLLP